MKTIQSKFYLTFGILLALGVIGAVLTLMFISKQKADAVVINLAGRQRMLTQKMSKEAFSLNQGIGDGETLQKTINLFDMTLNGLISGDNELGLPPAKNSAILSRLDHVKKLWISFHKNLDMVMTNPNQASAALSYVNDHNTELLKEMNTAVTMFEWEAMGKMTSLRWLAIIIGITTVVTIILSWIFIMRPFIKTLIGIIHTMNDASSQVAAASEEISSASQSVANGAASQAASIEETTASMEEVSTMIKQNADNAAHASNLVDTCYTSAENGNAVVGEMNVSMEEINQSNKKIAEIIKVIDSIAFQTNLLALNAAVEAARAGEHGKGFAVVAEEVRNLAQRSANAAKDTAALIEDSVGKANNGADLSSKCRKSLQDIVNNVKQMTGLTKEIAEASAEQSRGIEHINTTIHTFEDTVQQNAANAEQTASGSEELSSQAQTLMGQVQLLSLQVGEDMTHHAMIPASAAVKTYPDAGARRHLPEPE